MNRISYFLKTAKSMQVHSGLYYKHVTSVNDDSSVVSKWSFKLIDDPRVIIYDCHRFIIQATSYEVLSSLLTQNGPAYLASLRTDGSTLLQLCFSYDHSMFNDAKKPFAVFYVSVCYNYFQIMFNCGNSLKTVLV